MMWKRGSPVTRTEVRGGKGDNGVPAMTESVAAQRLSHQCHGTTIHVVFPADAPFDVVEACMQAIADAADVEREGWDPFIYASRFRFDLSAPDA
jgi:hypothetical protein